VSERSGPVENEATVRVATGPLLGPVLSRVIGMLTARADWPVDRVDDAVLVADTIAAHGGKHARNGHLTVDVHARADELELTVGSLTADGARGLHSDARLPGVGNVLDRIAQDVAVTPHPQDASEVLVIRLAANPA
jgi:hypothetical protein